MLSLPPAVRIFVATAPTNMHLSFDRLAALARDVVQQDPLSGHLFAFFNRSAKRATFCIPPSEIGKAKRLGVLQLREVARATSDDRSHTYPDRCALERLRGNLPGCRRHSLNRGEHAGADEAVH